MMARWQVIALSVALMLTAGGAMKNTPAQELAWERWQKCSHIPTVTLKGINPNGQISVFYIDPGRLAEWKACERAASLAQQKAGGLAAVQGPPSETEARNLVSYAYFTNAPPTSEAYLTPVVGESKPPEVKDFSVGTPVTFLYGIRQVGRTLNIETRWSGPGDARLTFKRVMAQTGRPGLWNWQFQTVEGRQFREPGAWSVDLMIDGQRIGTYPFVVR